MCADQTFEECREPAPVAYCILPKGHDGAHSLSVGDIGAEAERARIVSWLREQCEGFETGPGWSGRAWAGAIERGEHVR